MHKGQYDYLTGTEFDDEHIITDIDYEHSAFTIAGDLIQFNIMHKETHKISIGVNWYPRGYVPVNLN